MIVKVRTTDDGWEYYNCSKGVKVRSLAKEQWKSVWGDKDARYIILNCLDWSVESILNVQMTVIVIFNNITIYTDNVAYLLNDDGKTIEKLN